MQTMGISEFKAHALKVLDQVAKTRDEIIVTKRGKPVARILPFTEETPAHLPGALADTLVFEEDIISPLGEDIWDACK